MCSILKPKMNRVGQKAQPEIHSAAFADIAGQFE